MFVSKVTLPVSYGVRLSRCLYVADQALRRRPSADVDCAAPLVVPDFFFPVSLRLVSRTMPFAATLPVRSFLTTVRSPFAVAFTHIPEATPRSGAALLFLADLLVVPARPAASTGDRRGFGSATVCDFPVIPRGIEMVRRRAKRIAVPEE